MADKLIRIQCIKCRTDIIYITHDGVIEEEAGSIFVGEYGSINIYCNTCKDGVECIQY